MRILALSDIHGSYDAVDQILKAEGDFDALLVCGDITTNGTPAEAEAAVRRMQQFGKPVLVVTGNMDPRPLEASMQTLGVSIDGTGRMIGDVGFFGVSAAPFSPLRTPYEISEEEISRKAESGWEVVAAARWKVFVPHAPPRDTMMDRIWSGKHVGSTAVRRFVEARQPDVLVCGHIHEARGTDRLGKTRLINCGAAGDGHYAVISIDADITVENRE